jgi:hypothetical protein
MSEFAFPPRTWCITYLGDPRCKTLLRIPLGYWQILGLYGVRL